MMASRSKGIKTSAPQLMSNVFEVRQDEDLKAVSVRTVYPDTQVTYRVYKLCEDTTDPTNGQLMKEISTTYPNAGFHRTKFDRSVRLFEGDHYSIVVSQKVA